MQRASRSSTNLGRLLAMIGLLLGSVASADHRPRALELTVDAGRFERQQTSVQFSIRPSDLPDGTFDRLERIAGTGGRLLLREVASDRAVGDVVVAQVDRPKGPDGPLRIVWILPKLTPAGTRRIFREDLSASIAESGPWSFGRSAEGQLELSHRGAPVFRYNTQLVSDPEYPGTNQPRDAYIHPAFAPSGAIVTGDYSRESHPHHRGFFLAYTKTEVGGLHPDFWNIQNGSGKVQFDHLGDKHAGPVSARFSTFHRWRATRADAEPLVVLLERWDLEAFDIPGNPYWLIDLTSTQRATESPMVLPTYRYGGMAYRGPDSFFPKGVLDVLTSEGLDRVEGDQKAARWVDLTGPVADGSDTYAGAVIFDHPSNVNHPTPARIHPTTLPFFCYVPGHDKAVTIGTDEPTVFRYRILIHDGHPDADRNERVWHDFAEPPTVAVSVESP